MTQLKQNLNVIEWQEGMDVEALAPCLIAGMPNDVYHSTPAISKSGLDKIAKTPAHYKRAKTKATKAMELGTAFHAMVLEPAVFDAKFLTLPDVKDRHQSEYKKAKESYGDGNVLVGEECHQLAGMYASLSANPKAAELTGMEGWRELSVFAHDPETGVLCRARFDELAQNEQGELIAVDLKTTSDAAPDEFSNSIARYRYHVQTAFYCDVLSWATGSILSEFWFLAVESKAPHGVICRYLDEASELQGRDEYRADLDLYAKCKAEDYWPCYDQPEDAEISLPDWRWRQIENDIVEDIV